MCNKRLHAHLLRGLWSAHRGGLNSVRRHNKGNLDMNVAYAIVTGILDESEVAVEVLEALQRALDFYRRLKEEGDLRMPGE